MSDEEAIRLLYRAIVPAGGVCRCGRDAVVAYGDESLCGEHAGEEYRRMLRGLGAQVATVVVWGGDPLQVDVVFSVPVREVVVVLSDAPRTIAGEAASDAGSRAVLRQGGLQ